MKALGFFIIILALVIGIVPQFTDCQSQGRQLTLENGRNVPMKCHWTAQAELALAGPVLALGGVMAASRRKRNMMGLGVIGLIMGVVAVLLPTQLIGVCASADMICNSLMKPILIFTGVLLSVASLGAIVLASRVED